MTKLYHPKSKTVRVVDSDDPSRELKLTALKRAGYRIGNLPADLEPSLEEEEELLPATEGDEEAEAAAGKEPVLAEHAPVEGSEDENPFADMSIKELRALAKENDVVIPFEVRKKTDIAALLNDELDLVEEDEDEGSE